MGGASMNDIKARMKSVQSTMQITKAMELVATSKLRRAKERAEMTRPYCKALEGAIKSLSSSSEISSSVWLTSPEGGRTLYVVIAGDRGLAGGYNSNIFKLVNALSANKDALLLPIGKKASEYYKRHNTDAVIGSEELLSEVGVGDALSLGEIITSGYLNGEFSSAVLVYTEFTSMMSQTPLCKTLLPLKITPDKQNVGEPLIEEEAEEMLRKIIPQYLGGLIWSSVCEAGAAEQGARRNSMNSANKNATEMIDKLMLGYNRARQAQITQEITEIVSGAEAL